MNGKIRVLCAALFLFSCKKNDDTTGDNFPKENAGLFEEAGSIDVGDVGAAEITAFDPVTKRLFVVNNGVTNKIDIVDLSNPALPQLSGTIPVAPYGGLVNSLAVKNGLLAAAIEAVPATDAGKIVVFRTDDYSLVKSIAVGSLPDMVAFSPDGAFIVSANEGEPNSTYTVDPEGTVSIIAVADNYSVRTLNFASFASTINDFKARGGRIYGPGATFAKDIEPEYVAISDDSKTAWVTLQENNAIAKIDLPSRAITQLFPLGFKDYNRLPSAMDPSDRDAGIGFGAWPVKGMYEPDGISVIVQNGLPYLVTANEGDAREYAAFAEVKRVGSLLLDPTAFPLAADYNNVTKLGRLNVTTTLGDADADGDFDALYSLGARSFSVWNGLTGALVWDSGNELEQRAVAAGVYDDGRSDDKGVEPEGVITGVVNGSRLIFVGMERADAVGIYTANDPARPQWSQLLKCGDAPEGLLFVPQKDAPGNRSLLIVSYEGDGLIKIYRPALQ